MDNNKRLKVQKILLIVLVPVALIVGVLGGFLANNLIKGRTANRTANIVSMIEKIGYVYDEQTGEAREITEEEIADLLVSGLLDRYSAYYTQEEFEEVSESAKGKQSGIGVNLYNTGEIAGVIFNSPAERAGIKAGDKLFSMTIDDKTVYYSDNGGKDFNDTLKNAPTGKQFELIVVRENERVSFLIAKENYVASYVKYYDSEYTVSFSPDETGELTKVTPVLGGMEGLDQNTAYIQLAGFNGGASGQMKQALEYMKDSGRDKLILDLRDNGGGYLDILQEIASYFIYNGGKSRSLVAYAEGKQTNQSFYTKKNNYYSNITKITVLANEDTASASECLIGAMLHYKDNFDQDLLIVEKNAEGVARTYGKGIMQTTYGLVGGGALKLTTAKIYLPDKTTSIHTVGFRPNAENAVERGGALARAIELLA